MQLMNFFSDKLGININNMAMELLRFINW